MMESRGFIGHTFAKSTQASYRTHLKSYLRFCLYFQLQPVPAAQSTIVSYISFLARTLQPSSIQNYINIIRILHEDNRLPNPLSQNFEVSNLLKGIARCKGKPPKQMLPMTPEILLAIKQKLDMTLPSDLTFWCACMLGFYGFLRKASMFPKSVTNPGTDCLLKGDIEIRSNAHFVLKVRRTKTIQFGERILSLPFCASPGQVLCPVRALFASLIHVQNDPSAPLFSYKSASGDYTCWTQEAFVTRLRSILNSVGLNEANYSGHSFRRGGATLAFRLGLSISEIKLRGDWRSSAVEKYIVFSEAQECFVAQALANGVTHYVI